MGFRAPNTAHALDAVFSSSDWQPPLWAFVQGHWAVFLVVFVVSGGVLLVWSAKLWQKKPSFPGSWSSSTCACASCPAWWCWSSF